MIQDAGLFGQKVVTGTLKDIAVKAKNKNLRPPVIVIIGQVVNSERRFNWLKKNRKILFTGLSKERFFMKVTHVHSPLIKIEPLASYKEFDAHLRNIGEFDWLAFTSRYGVRYFFERLQAIGLDFTSLSSTQIAVIGNSTKSALLEREIRADLVPKKESSISLLKEFKKIDLKDKKIFLPCSDLSDKGLTDGIKRMGARVTASIAYRKELGVARQTLYNWIEKGWVKPKKDYRSYPVFTDNDIRNIKKWQNALKE